MDVKIRMTDTANSMLNNLKAEFPSKKLMGNLASAGKVLIMARTEKGKDEGGAQFGAYRTEPYYAQTDGRRPGTPAPSGGEITKSGKSMKFDSFQAYKVGLGRAAHVTLSLTGEMLASIAWLVRSKTRSTLFLAGREHAAKAHGHHTGYYPFFGLGSVESAKELLDELRKELASARRKARARARKEIKKT